MAHDRNAYAAGNFPEQNGCETDPMSTTAPTPPFSFSPQPGRLEALPYFGCGAEAFAAFNPGAAFN
jgi:hypothetical protein